jgi:hypothetical protein
MWKLLAVFFNTYPKLFSKIRNKRVWQNKWIEVLSFFSVASSHLSVIRIFISDGRYVGRRTIQQQNFSSQRFSNWGNRFKVFKSVHHRTIQINHQPDATIFQFIILTFIYSSTCFGRPHDHHQEVNDCSSSLWFYLRSVVIAVLFKMLDLCVAVLCWLNSELTWTHKNKFHPITRHEGPGGGGKKYSSTLTLTPKLDEVGGQSLVPAASPLGEKTG